MKLVVDLNDEVYNNIVIKNEYTDMDVIAVHNALLLAVPIDEKNVPLMTLPIVNKNACMRCTDNNRSGKGR